MSRPELIEGARRLYDSRRMRDELFGEERDAFGEPGWDMLLWLYAHGDTPATEDDLLAAARMREDTAVRYLQWLLARELIVAVAIGGGVSAYRLTQRGEEIMTVYLERQVSS